MDYVTTCDAVTWYMCKILATTSSSLLSKKHHQKHNISIKKNLNHGYIHQRKQEIAMMSICLIENGGMEICQQKTHVHFKDGVEKGLFMHSNLFGWTKCTDDDLKLFLTRLKVNV